MSKINKTDTQWKEKLTDLQYRVLRQGGTEKPFTGEFVDKDDEGTYLCAACGSELFSSDTKFHSGSGWPSFWDVAEEGNVELRDDFSLGMKRVEVVCSNCGGHLGHLFEDGPRDQTGLRYCINSAALDFEPNE